MHANLTLLQKDIGYTFSDIELLRLALTHRSFSKFNNERLEFLGDGVLDYVIASCLYERYPHFAEGVLSKLRSVLVNKDCLSSVAKQIKLGDYLFIGEGEIKSGGRTRPSMLADALEAIFAAITLDSDISEVFSVIIKLFEPHFAVANSLIQKDSKSILQEYLQARHIDVPEYRVINLKGPDHDSIFNVECVIPKLHIDVTGYGKSKKEASQKAAAKALEIIGLKELDAKR